MAYDLLIFNGQSNMQGQSEALIPSDPVQNAYEYKLIGDKLIPLRDPAGENILNNGQVGYDCRDEYAIPQWVEAHALGASYHGNTNMVCEFVRAYIKESKRSVIAVHAAKGSTKIADWQKGGDSYHLLTTKIKAAIAKVGQKNIGKIYFIFLQGESDVLNQTLKEEYKQLLINYYNCLKSDINFDRFCIIKVGEFAKFFNVYGDEVIAQAQEEICSEKEFLMLTRITGDLIKDSKNLNPCFVGHFGAKAQMIIGERGGFRLGAYAKGKTLWQE